MQPLPHTAASPPPEIPLDLRYYLELGLGYFAAGTRP